LGGKFFGDKALKSVPTNDWGPQLFKGSMEFWGGVAGKKAAEVTKEKVGTDK
jgi:hypothetical protein